jgi:hypothetical protein
MPQAFDVVYSPIHLVGFPEPDSTLLTRRVEAIDRAHALLWYLRSELGIVVDPVTMFDKSQGENGFKTYELDCGCGLRMRFNMHELKWLERRRLGVPAIPYAEVETEPCADHEEDDHRAWNGILRAWKHSPKLPKTFTQGIE